MQRIKLVILLAMAIFPLLAWMVGLSTAATPLVQSVGVYGSIAYAAAIAVCSAWMLVIFLEEFQRT